MKKELARPTQTAEHFLISKQTLWRWTQEEGFPQPMRRGRVTLYDLKAIEEWLQNGGQ